MKQFQKKLLILLVAVVISIVIFSFILQDEEKIDLKLFLLSPESQLWMRRLIYWRNTKRNYQSKPIIKDRYLTWFPWEAGHNNRRMSLELAYTFAYLTNRTLVLPLPSGGQHPFTKPILYEWVYDFDDMKAGVPTITNEEFKKIPNINSYPVATVNWTDIPSMDSCVGWPSMPVKGTPEWERYVEWRKPRTPEGHWGHPHEPSQIPDFHTAPILHFPHHVLFTHFYILFFFAKDSPVQLPNITRLIRDYVHFREEIFVYASIILSKLPPTFSTIHYRRDDLQFEDNRWISPVTIFKNIENLLHENETIYVATDEKPQIFRDEFKSVFVQRYEIITLNDYIKDISGIPKEWVPLVEMVVLSQGRVFIGTRQSTFSGYVTRLRGYMNSVENKEIYWTIRKYPDDYNGVPDLYKGWDREYPEAWANIMEDDEFSNNWNFTLKD